MFEFERPNIEVVEISEDKKYGRFVVEPLERGYGITLGNSLRRIMLSSLPGVAVSQVKIEGVLHEFSSIPGVKEDVTEIIMNVKSLAIKNNSDANEVKTAYIEYEGEGIVRVQADVSVGELYRMESVEYYAKILMNLRMMNAERPMTAEQIDGLLALRPDWGVTGGGKPRGRN